MSRWSEDDDHYLDRDRRHEPLEPPIDPDPEAWESHCAGNKTHRHLAPSAKLARYWRCGSCGRWLRPPKGRILP
jgi:hypothetical protein